MDVDDTRLEAMSAQPLMTRDYETRPALVYERLRQRHGPVAQVDLLGVPPDGPDTDGPLRPVIPPRHRRAQGAERAGADGRWVRRHPLMRALGHAGRA
jgi:hypothetical protein